MNAADVPAKWPENKATQAAEIEMSLAPDAAPSSNGLTTKSPRPESTSL